MSAKAGKEDGANAAAATGVEAENARLREEIGRYRRQLDDHRRELDDQRRELRRLRRANRTAGNGGGHDDEADDGDDDGEPGSPSLLERLPQDMRSRVLEFSGGEAWHRGVRSANKALRSLCKSKEVRDMVRRWAMGEFKRGMDSYHGTNGSVLDKKAGWALVRRAAAAGLRPAMAQCFCSGWGASPDYVKAAALWQAELDDSASETEASGGACCWSAYYLARFYGEAYKVQTDYPRALELYTHAAETDENGRAMYRLYEVYRHGQLGQDEDQWARAVSWVRRSADSGHFYACDKLGWILEHGQLGVDVNLKEALRCYEKDVEQRPECTYASTYKITRVRAAIAAQADSNSDAEADA